MLSAIVGMFFYGIGLGGPSNADALEALQERFYNPSGGFVDPATRIDDIEVRFNLYPQFVNLKVCNDVIVQSSQIRSSLYNRGFSCLVEVVPNGLAPYNVRGTFLFDGLKWRFIGNNRPARFRPQETLRTLRGSGERILKPGALPYDGNPDFPLNDVESPYKDILNPDSLFLGGF